MPTDKAVETPEFLFLKKAFTNFEKDLLEFIARVQFLNKEEKITICEEIDGMRKDLQMLDSFLDEVISSGKIKE